MLQRIRGLAVLAVIVALMLGTLVPAFGAEIIAHRGASYDAPENTLASVNLAWAQGADVAEFDVHLSRDGEIVVLHDANTRRTTGHDARVSRLALEELRSLDAGSWIGPQWVGERIPTLAEVLATVPAGRRVFIDVKAGREIVPELVRVLRESNLSHSQVAVIGFSLRTLEAVKEALPDVEVYWLVNVRQHPESGAWMPSSDNLIRRAERAGIDGVNLRLADVIDGEYVERFHEAGLGLYVWGVHSPEAARGLICAGVDGITTNRPGWMREQLQLLPECAAVGE